MNKFIEKLIGKLEEASHWEESTFDEDGYCNDDSEEVVYLYKAIEIVNQLAKEYEEKVIVDTKEIRNEAIAEFAERMKQMCKGITIAEKTIDEIADEMKGTQERCRMI